MACNYMYLCTDLSEGYILCTKNQLYGNSTCTENCRVNYMRNTEDKHRDSIRHNQWSLQTCIRAVKWNRMHVHVTMHVCVPSLSDRFIVCHMYLYVSVPCTRICGMIGPARYTAMQVCPGHLLSPTLLAIN